MYFNILSVLLQAAPAGSSMDSEQIIHIVSVLLLALVLWLLSKRIKKPRNKQSASFASQESAPQATNRATPHQEEPPKNARSKLDALTEYKRLLDDGLITKEEFDERKERLLK